MFDYSVCDFCPFDAEYDTYSGSVCENCQAKADESRRIQMIAESLERRINEIFVDLDDEDSY